MKINEQVSNYIELRDLLATMKAEYETAIAPLKEAQDGIEAKILEYFQATGVESARTENGTVYKSIRTSATVADWNIAFEHIQSHELWHMLEHRVSKLAVEQYMEEHQEAPPGVNVTRMATVNFRRS